MCSECGYSYVVYTETPRSDHIYDVVYNDDNTQCFVCSVCGYTVTDVVKARYDNVEQRKAEIDLLLSENDSLIPKVFITTDDGDTIHKSTYIGCAIDVVDPSGSFDTISENNGYVKIRGNSTSGGSKKPYNIKFESKTELLGLGKSKKWYLLSNQFDKTMLRNKLALDFADTIGMDYVSQSTFVEVYLNGVYCGCYQLCESIGVGKQRVDIDIDNYEFLLEIEPYQYYSNDNYIRSPIYNVILGFNEPDTPTEEQYNYVYTLLEKIENLLHSDFSYEDISQYLDVESFIDAYIVQELFKQVDYGTSSTRFYIKNGRLYEGPVWDFDLSSGNCSSDYYTDYYNEDGVSYCGFWCLKIWNKYLFKNDVIYDMLKSRYAELQPYIVNLYSDNEVGECVIDGLVSQYEIYFEKNNVLWHVNKASCEFEHTPVDGTYDGEISFLKEWLENRNSWLLSVLGIA